MRSRVGSRRRAAVGLAALCALAPGIHPLSAQESEHVASERPSEPASAPRRSRALAIEEIIVTARKREESLQEVPISLSVLDGEFLAAQGITDLREMSSYVPNTSLDVDGFFLRPRMRGFATYGNEGFEQPIGLVIDGVAYGAGPYFQSALFDLDRVEVLRGPQGTLFGKNTTVGLVNLLTRNPTDELTGNLDMQIGNLERRRFEAAIGGPLIANVLNFRIAGLSDERDGIVRNTTKEFVPEANDRLLGKDRKGLRSKIELPNAFGVNLVVGYERIDLELGGGGEELRLVPEGVRPFFLQHDPKTDFERDNFVGSIDSPERNLRTIDNVVVNGGYDLAGWGFDLVAGWSSLTEDDLGDGDFGPIPIAFFDSLRDSGQWTVELRAASPSLAGLFGLERLFDAPLGSTDFSVGFFYQTRTLDDFLLVTSNEAVIAEFLLFQNDPTGGGQFPEGTLGEVDQDGPPTVIEAFFKQEQQTIAGFAQMDWRFLPGWTLLYGMRLSHESKDAFWNQVISDNSVLLARIFDEFKATQGRSELDFSPKVGARYDWSDDVGFYATWARGVRSGGFDATLATANADTREVDPEKVRSWELGSKLRLLGGAATLNLGLFWMNVTDFQLVTEVPTGILDAPVVVNVGEIRARGVEADLVWQPADWLRLLAAIGFNDSEFLEFPFGICEEDRTDTDRDGDARCDLTGGPLERAPKWVFTLVPRVDYPLARLPGLGALTALPLTEMDLTASLTVEYQDTQFLRETLDPRTRQGSFFRLDAMVGLADLERGWSLGFTVENLTDVATASLVEDVAVSNGTFGHFVEPPRLFFGAFRWKF